MSAVKSITIKEPILGTKLIKIVFKNGKVTVEAINSVVPFDCLIVYEDKERLTIPVRRKS